jgi:hypothetical protein
VLGFSNNALTSARVKAFRREVFLQILIWESTADCRQYQFKTVPVVAGYCFGIALAGRELIAKQLLNRIFLDYFSLILSRFFVQPSPLNWSRSRFPMGLRRNGKPLAAAQGY